MVVITVVRWGCKPTNITFGGPTAELLNTIVFYCWLIGIQPWMCSATIWAAYCPGVSHPAEPEFWRPCPGRCLCCATGKVIPLQTPPRQCHPVGMRYSSRPWASFRSQNLLVCWYRRAATGRAKGSHPLMSNLAVEANVLITLGRPWGRWSGGSGHVQTFFPVFIDHQLVMSPS